MGNTNPQNELTDRVSVRVPEWITEWISNRAKSSGWASESQVARDMLELGILVSALNDRDFDDDPAVESRRDPPHVTWTRPQGAHPNDETAVCPECGQSDPVLFRHRVDPVMADVDALHCLWCGHMGEASEFSHSLPDGNQWVRTKPRGRFHIGDMENRRTLCDRYSAPFATIPPKQDVRPTDICRPCWRTLLGKE